ncbi:hypothetical protein DES53_10340 [Roseimicrobium gellanilyticum]|uniref:DUF4175 family protein n=1 Tax=Roseimicrobium gellanilyticum TaxID=748857 RepID=A0A366HNH7_9BACT|nr:hypothetical protein [Roseimicrobium gellanilyticum]RBP45045.1 hypothetical protein DES53_10340 [Roseimicrobium gellanilyticum]
MASSNLHSALTRSATTVRKGLLLAGGLLAVVLVLAVLLVAGITDYYLGWEPSSRKMWVLFVLAVLVVGVLVAVLRARLLPLRDVAARADEASGAGRREIQSALELSEEETADGTLQQYLTQQTINRSVGHLAKVPQAHLWPRRETRQAWLVAGGALLLMIALVALQPRASKIITHRFLHPGTELAPYSPHEFSLGKGGAEVVYGRDISLAVDITGAPIEEEVRLLTRPDGGGEVTNLPTFRESGTRFTRKLEGVTQPLEYAFSLGRGRSVWKPLEVLWQPELEAAQVEVRPPAYAGLANAQFLLGTEDLRGLRGSQVRLRALSNRPLSGGTLEARAPQGREVIARVDGVPLEAGGKEVEFRWNIEADCVWTLNLRDVRGGQMQDPVLIAQRLLPDEKPKVELTSPGPVAFATPQSAVTLAWEVEEDFGLERVDLVRAADGFRDRTRSLTEGPGEKNLNITREVKLPTLGVRPGETLEFMLEARDRNPSLLGVGSSPPARVKIISEEEYGEQVRLRTTLAEFVERYRALREKLEAAQKSLEKVAEAAKAGDKDKLDEARKEAEKAQREAAEWFEAFAKEFPAFATDKELSELAGGLKEELEKNADELQNSNDWSDPAKAQALAKKLGERLQQGAEQLAQQEQEANDLAAVGGVLEMAAELQAARDEQREVSEALSRLAEEVALGKDTNRHKLPGLRAQQAANHERIKRVQEQLPGRLEKLPEGYENLKQGAERVLDQIDLLQVPKQMSDATSKAGQGKLTGAAADSVLARANLDQILGSSNDDFCKTCQGSQPGFCNGQGMAEQAMAQMLAALRGRAQGGRQGNSPGSGGAGGLGAVGGSGSAMEGMQLEVPIIGPPRVNLRQPPSSRGGKGNEARQTHASDESPKAADQNHLPSATSTQAGGRAWRPEDVPPKYREAVKSYFSDEPKTKESAP